MQFAQVDGVETGEGNALQQNRLVMRGKTDCETRRISVRVEFALSRRT